MKILNTKQFNEKLNIQPIPMNRFKGGFYSLYKTKEVMRANFKTGDIAIISEGHLIGSKYDEYNAKLQVYISYEDWMKDEKYYMNETGMCFLNKDYVGEGVFVSVFGDKYNNYEYLKSFDRNFEIKNKDNIHRIYAVYRVPSIVKTPIDFEYIGNKFNDKVNIFSLLWARGANLNEKLDIHPFPKDRLVPRLSLEQKAFVENHHLTYNVSTQRFDGIENLILNDKDLVDGKIPVPVGKLGGNFNSGGCSDLVSLENAPTEVKGNFQCAGCQGLTSLKGSPQKVGGWFSCAMCNNIETLEGAPQEIGSDFNCSSCKGLLTMKGAPKQVIGNLDCSNCENLQTLEGAPQKVGGGFWCNRNVKLKNLIGAPQEIGGDALFNKCTDLVSFDGSPKTVKGNFDFAYCTNLERINDVPLNISGDFVLSFCYNLVDVSAVPEYVGGNINLNGCVRISDFSIFDKCRVDGIIVKNTRL
jgi:hypothetical protein